MTIHASNAVLITGCSSVASPSAHVMKPLRRVLGDRGWDRWLRGVYPSPGEEPGQGARRVR